MKEQGRSDSYIEVYYCRERKKIYTERQEGSDVVVSREEDDDEE